MAQRTLVQLTDDLDGTIIEDGSGKTETFSLNGKTYEIDLKATNAEKFEKALAKYIEAAREVRATSNVTSMRGRGRASTRATGARPDKEQMAAMRQWAQENGFQVAERGRIPNEVQEAYHAAHAS